MCLETFLAVNLLADLMPIVATSRALGLFSWRRALAADALCALYAVIAVSRRGLWASPAAQAAMLGVLCCVLSGRMADRQFGRIVLSLCAAVLTSGGVAAIVHVSGVGAAILCPAFGSLTLCALFAAHPPASINYQVEVSLLVDGRTARFTALVDTGNRLREPLSGLPVLIAEAGLLRGLLPADGYRMLHYGAIGGEGRMACFRPAAVWVGHGPGRRRAPDVWIAVAPKRLPGVFRALAPSMFALYM